MKKQYRYPAWYVQAKISRPIDPFAISNDLSEFLTEKNQKFS